MRSQKEKDITIDWYSTRQILLFLKKQESDPQYQIMFLKKSLFPVEATIIFS